MFLPARSETGALALRWPPQLLESLSAWILLVNPTGLDPDVIGREAFLRELIRVPLDARAGEAVVHVPVGRPLGLVLIGRAPGGDAVAPIAPTVREALVAAPPVPRAPPSATTPLIMPLRDGAPERLDALARSIAERAAVPAPRAIGPTGFGLRQRRTLTRLAFVAADAERPRVAIARATFIGPDELAAWREAPPADAVPLPADADGLVDALTADDAMAFYAVLEGPAPWRSLPLEPVPPPFERVSRPHVLGDARPRLAALAAAAPPDGPVRELVDAARRGMV